MDTEQPPASLVRIDGRLAVRFERSYRCSTASFWHAVTDPDALQRWFPSMIAWTPTVGERFEIDGVPGEVLELHHDELVVWKADVEHYRFEVVAGPALCTFVFVHCFDPEVASAAQYAAGWEIYLERLRVHLSGGYLTEETAHVQMAGVPDRYETLFAADCE